MRDPDFKFRQFSIWQDRCAMKVGTDGVLLGAWADLAGCTKILDIGTGTGLLALMAAQRVPEAIVTAVEIDPEAASQAAGNIAASPWKDRINVVSADIREYRPGISFDAILCNPPYFRNSLRCPDKSRSTARHGDTLSFEELALSVQEMLSPDGHFHVVLPYEAVPDFIKASSACGLQLHRQTDVRTKAGKQIKRSLLESGKLYRMFRHDEITIIDNTGYESDEYVNLVKNFYIKY